MMWLHTLNHVRFQHREWSPRVCSFCDIMLKTGYLILALGLCRDVHGSGMYLWQLSLVMKKSVTLDWRGAALVFLQRCSEENCFHDYSKDVIQKYGTE